MSMSQALAVIEQQQIARIDRKWLQGFYLRTNSPETQRAYKRAIMEFWTFVRAIDQTMIDPVSDFPRIATEHVQAWRDYLMSTPSPKTGRPRRPATVARDLKVITAAFD